MVNEKVITFRVRRLAGGGINLFMYSFWDCGFITVLCDTWFNGTILISFAFQILLFVSCFMYSYFIGAAEASSLSDIRKKAERKNKKALKALNILENEDKYIRSFSMGRKVCMSAGIGINVCVLAPLALRIFMVEVVKRVLNLEEIEQVEYYYIWSLISTIIVFLLVTLFFSVFGCEVPERLGRLKAEKSLMAHPSLYSFSCKLYNPLASLAHFFSDIICKNKEKNTGSEKNNHTEEEILMMVDEGKEIGELEDNTSSMIENILDFDDTPVGEIMTHRKDVIAVKTGTLITVAAKTAMESGKSRLPVYGDDTDDIVGMLYAKDLLRYVSTNASTERIDERIIKEAVFVPESKRCSEMFETMTKNKTQIAVVVDEFGGTSGIITMEDLMEFIFGSIQDEYDNEDEDIKKLGEGRFTVSGSTSLDEISEITGIDFEDDSNETVAGIILDRMGRVPKAGEHPSIMISGTRFTVQSIDKRRISRVLIVKGK